MTTGPALGFLEAVDPLLLQPHYAVFDRGIRIGRDAEQCEVILSRDFVSRQHCAITVDHDGLQLLDLNTTNGTFVNGQKVHQHALREGDRIGLGKAAPHQFVFTSQARQQVRRYILGLQKLYQIGRAQDCDLPLPQDPTVSAAHAQIRLEREALYLEDLGSANGTFVNGHAVRRVPLLPQDEVLIGTTRFHFTHTAEGLLVSLQEQRNQVRLESYGLGRTVRDRRLLQDINLVIHPGEYVGVLGPSGAGKSTLLNALNGFQPATEGTVLLNNVPLYSSYDMFRNAIGYVPQDDIIHADLSVERSLFYTARLRLPRDSGLEQVGQQITSVIETLGMGHVRKNPVARLSGGQRKRVSIGCELLTKPSLMFLDEPTSGLDPSTEEKLMKHFRQMSEQGQTVILTTHILYSLDLVDLVILLAKGRLVYFGPVKELCAHFSTPDRSIIRPVEIFDVLEPERSSMAEREDLAQRYADTYRQSRLYEAFVAGRSDASQLSGVPSTVAEVRSVDQSRRHGGKRRPGLWNVLEWGRQFCILTQRTFDLKFSLPARLVVPFLVPVLLALITATIKENKDTGEERRQEFLEMSEAQRDFVFSDTPITAAEFQQFFLENWANVPITSSLPLMMIMTAVFLGTLSACLEISSERPIYLRERAVNLRIPVYVASKLPALLLFAGIQSFVYVGLTSVLLNLDLNQINVMALVLILFWVASISSLIGLFISSLDPTAGSNSVVLAVVAVLPQLVFSGALAPSFYGDMDIVTKTVASALPARWGFEMMLTTFYQTPDWAHQLIEDAPKDGGMGFRFGSQVYLRNSVVLGGLAMAYFAATCVSLKRYDRL